ncbi:MAG: glycosyltransferase family 2 protein [Nitrospiria bacterium]
MTRIPLASIIVVNWNGMGTIQKCLESLLAQSYPSIEVIVVDNHSEDGSYEKGVALFKEKIKWIRNSKNEGFARGNNVGIQASTGEYILLLNNDAWADRDWVHHLVSLASLDRQTGMAASRIYLAGEDRVFDNTGHLVYPDGLSWGRGRNERDVGQFDRELEVIFPSGCAALYKKEMLAEIGLFDEMFFAYCEDTDLGFRARLYGWKCFYSPKAIVYHHFSGSTSQASRFKAYLVERNRRWVMMKNYPLSLLMRSPWYTFIRYFWQVYGVLKGKGMASEFVRQYSFGSGIAILMSSFWGAWKRSPVMFKERCRIMKNKKMSSKSFGDLLRRYGVSGKKVALGEKE